MGCDGLLPGCHLRYLWAAGWGRKQFNERVEEIVEHIVYGGDSANPASEKRI